MVSFQSPKFGIVRRFAVGVLLGGSAIAATGCSLIPTTDDIRSATTTVKDTVTGKARRDKQNKTYAEARILERRKDFAGAERLYRELLVVQPKSRDCYHRLGVMAAVQGKYADAQQLYQTALSCSEPTADLLSDIGYCHYLQQQLPLAEQALRAAVAIQPQHPAALNNLAMVVGEQGNLDEAYDLFRRANNEAEAESNFAYLCAQCGDLQNAQAHFSRALSVNPDMRPAAEALLQVTQAMQRRQDEARAYQAELAAQGNAVQQASTQQSLAPQAQNPTAIPQQAGVVNVGGYVQAAAAQNGAVQLASNNANIPSASRNASMAAAAAPQQRLIEVYRGGPRTAAGSAQAARASAPVSAPAASQSSPAAPQTAIAPAAVAPAQTNPITNQFPMAAGWSNGVPNTTMPSMNSQAQSAAPTPFSYPSTPSPQYMQPSASLHVPTNGPQGEAVSPASYNAPVRNVAAPNAGVPTGLSFPPAGG